MRRSIPSFYSHINRVDSAPSDKQMQTRVAGFGRAIALHKAVVHAQSDVMNPGGNEHGKLSSNGGKRAGNFKGSASVAGCYREHGRGMGLGSIATLARSREVSVLG